MTVYLRKQPAGTPVDYIKSLEKAGLVVMPQRQLAIYTCKSGAGPAGAKGDPGEDQNSWFDTIIAADSYHVVDAPISVAGVPVSTFRSPYPLDLTLGYVRCSLTTAPDGADVIIDVHMNGSTIFSTPIHIDNGSKTSVGSATPAVISVTYIPDDAEFQVYVLQHGTIVAGAGLKTAVTGIKTD